MMQDLLYLGISAAFFGLTGLLLKICEMLYGDKTGGRP
jgi:hypothetical protein